MVESRTGSQGTAFATTTMRAPSAGLGMLTHSLEDYLEAIVTLAGSGNEPVRPVDVASKLQVSKASVTKSVSALREKGLVTQEHYGDIALTPEGFRYGNEIWRRHNLLYRFMTEVLGIDQATANQEACQIEHGISPQSFSKWEEYLRSVGIEIDQDPSQPPDLGTPTKY